MPTNAQEFRESIDKIKDEIRQKKGKCLTFERQTGKSSALLEIAHDDYHGEAIILSPNAGLAQMMAARYGNMYPGERRVRCFYGVHQTRGYSLPILVDEWFAYDQKTADELLSSGMVVAMIGTVPF